MDYTINDRIIDLMNSKNLSSKDFALSIGVKPSNITEWKKHRCRPTVDALIQISVIYDISIDYILFGKIVTDLNKDEKLLIECYRSASDENRYHLIKTAELVRDSRREEEELSTLQIG